ncbi:MAG: AAA family ATPase [Muribaculaceae bacterium]|nr:AAA family ATPase [Muribaculaceae bacterium]
MSEAIVKYITAEEAALRLGVTSRRIQQLCSSGKVSGAKIEANSWVLPEESLSKIPVRKKATTVTTKKPLPIGISDFKRAVSEYYYIDKTLLIKEFLDSKPQVSLFTRPRRFGKTLNMDMLRVFFEKSSEDTSVYFADKKIWKCGSKYRNEQGKYPVIFISLKDVKFNSWAETFEMIKVLVRSEFARHNELASSDKLSEYDKQRYAEILSGGNENDTVVFSYSLGTLTKLLYKHHSVKPILIIDEYDVPVQQGHSCGFYDDIISFLRNFFSNGLKDNPNVSYAFMTGILKIAKESIFSGMNNLKTDSIFDDRYSEYFGFTKEEVKALLKYYGKDNKYEEVCVWYDGYKFGNTEIFNPWSIINYVDDKCSSPKAYWVSTGSNDIIGEIIEGATSDVMDNLNKLMRKESISTYIDTSVIYPEIKKNPSSIYSFLLVAGYLNVVEKQENNDCVYCKVAIPNKEISFVYEKEILSKLDNIVQQSTAISIQSAIFERDTKKLQTELQNLLINSISYNDTSNESFYHGLTVGLCATMNNRYYVYSNRESGTGRFDIALEPQNKQLPGIIIELKSGKDETDTALEKLAQKALEQIDNNKYDADLKMRGVKKMLKFGIAFCGKNVKIAFKED